MSTTISSENSGEVCKSLILGGVSPRKLLNLLDAKKFSGVFSRVAHEGRCPY